MANGITNSIIRWSTIPALEYVVVLGGVAEFLEPV